MDVVRGLALAVAVAAAGATGASGQSTPDGQALYRERCASCHGASLEGQLDWKTRKPNGRMPAPPHDSSGHTWHHRDEQLFRITKEGPAATMPGYESDMPGFGAILSEAEICAVLDYIKGTWPERQRALQAARSKAPGK